MSKQTFFEYMQKVFEGQVIRILEFFRDGPVIDLVLVEADGIRYWYNKGDIIPQQ